MLDTESEQDILSPTKSISLAKLPLIRVIRYIHEFEASNKALGLSFPHESFEDS